MNLEQKSDGKIIATDTFIDNRSLHEMQSQQQTTQPSPTIFNTLKTVAYFFLTVGFIVWVIALQNYNFIPTFLGIIVYFVFGAICFKFIGDYKIYRKPMGPNTNIFYDVLFDSNRAYRYRSGLPMPVTWQGWLIDLTGVALVVLNVFLLTTYYSRATNPSTNPWFAVIGIIPSLIITGLLLWTRRRFGPYKV